jgi:hypothetical protein
LAAELRTNEAKLAPTAQSFAPISKKVLKKFYPQDTHRNSYPQKLCTGFIHSWGQRVDS